MNKIIAVFAVGFIVMMIGFCVKEIIAQSPLAKSPATFLMLLDGIVCFIIMYKLYQWGRGL